MFRSVRAVPHIEIERESDPARVSLFHGELLGTLLRAPFYPVFLREFGAAPASLAVELSADIGGRTPMV
jgi:hypothetical protein